MISPEIFYLHLHGEQRGPYPQVPADATTCSISRLCGFIAEETLYWREGLEQWQPVTDIVKLRKRANPWLQADHIIFWLRADDRLALCNSLARSRCSGWREASSTKSTAQAAYHSRRAGWCCLRRARPGRGRGNSWIFRPRKWTCSHRRRPRCDWRGKLPSAPARTERWSGAFACSTTPKHREWNGEPQQEAVAP